MGIAMESSLPASRDMDGYERLLADVQLEFDMRVKNGKEPVFTTDATGLYDKLLQKIPEEARQHYNCRACRRFVDKYGGLVVVTDAGGLKPAVWPSGVPQFFKEGVEDIRKAVSRANITGVFYTSEKVLGTPVTGPWEHLSLSIPAGMRYSKALSTAFQGAAEKREDFILLSKAVEKYSMDIVQEAVNILRSDVLYGGEKVLKPAEWLLAVKVDTEKRRGKKNLLWKYAATAPTGYCHISENMLGTLLDDIYEGRSLESIKRRFGEKMDPTKYQRPQAAPTAGNVAAAEKIVEQLGLERSLRRRFARLEELPLIWKPEVEKVRAVGGVFAGLDVKKKTPPRNVTDIPASTMTWVKFRDTVLPAAKKIEFLVGYKQDSYAAIVTAADMDAPPIIQWDTVEHRNPLNWYLYSAGSYPGRFELKQGWTEVTGVMLQPNMLQECGYQEKAVFFILKGARDRDYHVAGSALFPSVLKGELHSVRSTIEAYSKKTSLEGYEEASACGIRLGSESRWWDYQFRVTTSVGVTTYKLDRWD